MSGGTPTERYYPRPPRKRPSIPQVVHGRKLRRLRAAVPGHAVLDVGCGPGRKVLALSAPRIFS